MLEPKPSPPTFPFPDLHPSTTPPYAAPPHPSPPPTPSQRALSASPKTPAKVPPSAFFHCRNIKQCSFPAIPTYLSHHLLQLLLQQQRFHDPLQHANLLPQLLRCLGWHRWLHVCIITPPLLPPSPKPCPPSLTYVTYGTICTRTPLVAGQYQLVNALLQAVLHYENDFVVQLIPV